MGETFLLVLGAYLLGSVPIGYLMAKLARGMDIREYGTGNVGGANVWRNVGRLWGVLVSLGTLAQGWVPVKAVGWLGYSSGVAGLAGLAAIVGYGWPVFMRFKGGRGTGVSLGVVAALAPFRILLILVLIFVLGLVLKRLALAVLFGFAVLPGLMWAAEKSVPLALIGLAIFLFLVVRRLEGVAGELKRFPHPGGIIRNRLLHDRRPLDNLTGRRPGL